MNKNVGHLSREIKARRKKQMEIPEINTKSEMKKLIG